MTHTWHSPPVGPPTVGPPTVIAPVSTTTGADHDRARRDQHHAADLGAIDRIGDECATLIGPPYAVPPRRGEDSSAAAEVRREVRDQRPAAARLTRGDRAETIARGAVVWALWLLGAPVEHALRACDRHLARKARRRAARP